MVNYIKEVLKNEDVVISILEKNNGKLGITHLIKEIRKNTGLKAVICRDLIISAGTKGSVSILKNPPNQLSVELPT
ncbi:MAG: hypothetical protein KAT05_04475 [Spirochaetes bacterium]|nr:hypothetical protein [Spirochaetota bacterium]